jgi:hypothetical protein
MAAKQLLFSEEARRNSEWHEQAAPFRHSARRNVARPQFVAASPYGVSSQIDKVIWNMMHI